jgi:hypothetical protein
MSTGTDILEGVLGETAIRSEVETVGPELVNGTPSSKAAEQTQTRESTLGSRLSASVRISGRWDAEEFAQQQILSLVQRVFFPGWPRPARQVVFSPVDGTADAGTTCARVCMVMAERLPGTVCAVEADPEDSYLCWVLAGKRRLEIVRVMNALKSGQPVQSNLWLLSPEEFYGEQKPGAAWLRSRLSELRRTFDYVVIHAPAVLSRSDTALVGQMTDGVILVLNEQRTRRAAAQQAKEVLLSANARLLGVVLGEREFAVPEQIYRKL